jgi:hypothetical protein
MDVSSAQCGAHAEEYAAAIISTMPPFSLFSQEAQQAEQQLILEARKGEFAMFILALRRSGQEFKRGEAHDPAKLDSEVLYTSDLVKYLRFGDNSPSEMVYCSRILPNLTGLRETGELGSSDGI